MASYGYGGGYSTTGYGAQGGPDGGGFVQGGVSGSNPGGSQDGSSKTYSKETLRPVTIKQIIDAAQPYPDADFKIDGAEITQLSFVGQVHAISNLATNITYKIDDGTGLIEVKQWVDGDAEPDSKRPPPIEGQYIHVWGRLKSFNDKRHVGARVIRIISDYNEINMHMLEATAVHLFYTRGPPGSGVKAEGGNGMFVDGYGHGIGANSTGGIQTGHKLPAKLSQPARKVFELLQTSIQNNEGLHVTMIASKLGMTPQEVYKAGDELLSDGQIYTTIDDETWAVLEY